MINTDEIAYINKDAKAVLLLNSRRASFLNSMSMREIKILLFFLQNCAIPENIHNFTS